MSSSATADKKKVLEFLESQKGVYVCSHGRADTYPCPECFKVYPLTHIECGKQYRQEYS